MSCFPWIFLELLGMIVHWLKIERKKKKHSPKSANVELAQSEIPSPASSKHQAFPQFH